ncbi:HEAT repeat domain-containing protein [Providencia hangzhouensis]|uniref:HEAT repeat domain-containing protein n=1 Tax=Providencia hangzhouensis TaxID=3031799 RepID=UPI0034DD8128
MDKVIVGMLTKLTFRVNDEIKIAAISALVVNFKATIEYNDAIRPIIDLCQDPNKEVAVSAINTLSKLSIYFLHSSLPKH